MQSGVFKFIMPAVEVNFGAISVKGNHLLPSRDVGFGEVCWKTTKQLSLKVIILRPNMMYLEKFDHPSCELCSSVREKKTTTENRARFRIDLMNASS